MMSVYNECVICNDPYKPCTGTPPAPATHHPRKVQLRINILTVDKLLQLRNNLFSLCKMRNSIMAPRKWHFRVPALWMATP